MRQIDLKESITVEFKREFVSDKIIKTIIAFANTRGGTLYIGMEDNGSIVGLSAPDNVCLQVTSAARDSVKPDVTMFLDCSQETHGDKTIVKVTVFKGTAGPYYLKSKGPVPSGVFVRQGSSSVPASRDAIRKMIKEADHEMFEDTPSRDQALTFVEAAKVFERHNMKLGEREMQSLGVKSEDGIYTNLGLILSDQCPFIITVAVFQDTDVMILRDRVDFSGSLLKQQDEVHYMLNRFNSTASEFPGKERLDIRDYPEKSLREALYNACAHRDYSSIQNTHIKIFKDRVEFNSPGNLVDDLSYERMMHGRSSLRNYKLAHIFLRLQLIEALGVGIPKIFQSYEEYHVKPKIEIDPNYFVITLPNINEARLAGQGQRLPHIEGAIPILEPREETILTLFNTREYITQEHVEEALSVTKRTATRYLRKLVEKNVLYVIGRAKSTKYLLNKGDTTKER